MTSRSKWIRYSEGRETRDPLIAALKDWRAVVFHPITAWRQLCSLRAASERVRRVNNQRFLKESLADSETVSVLSSLTKEQRRAVLIDEDHNLVVAAAGSGKTSVIVAKADWLIRKGYRRPSELLLLAFSRNARKELEDRLHRKGIADDLTVQTFHKLGMTIIGEAEGRRPTLSKVAEDGKALHELLKQIVNDLKVDGKLSGALLDWFQAEFAPYRREHEFQNQGEYFDYIRKHEIRSLNGEKVKSFEEC